MNIFDSDGSHPLDNADWDDEPTVMDIEVPDVEITPVVQHVNTFSQNENNCHVQASLTGADFTVSYQDGGYWDDEAGCLLYTSPSPRDRG